MGMLVSNRLRPRYGNGHYELAEWLIDGAADVNQADAADFPPLFWAVDRRNMEWNPGFPWVLIDEVDPLIEWLTRARAAR
jgi:hypothetical protein